MLPFLANFFAGAFLCNCLPHLIAGLQGRLFPTPFAKPPGRGDSPALVNFLWGAFNLGIGLALLTYAPIHPQLSPPTLVFAAGVLVMGTHLSLHFSVSRGKKSA